MLKDRDTRDIEVIMETEKTIDHMEKMLTEYLIKVDNLPLNEHQKLVVAIFSTASAILSGWETTAKTWRSLLKI